MCPAHYEAVMLAIHEIQHVAMVENGETQRRAAKVVGVLEQVGLIQNGKVTDLKAT